MCLRPTNSHVVLRPWPGYMPKVSTTPFRDQVVNLHVLTLEEVDTALALCVLFALCMFMWTTCGALEALKSSLSVLEVSRRERLSPNRGCFACSAIPFQRRCKHYIISPGRTYQSDCSICGTALPVVHMFTFHMLPTFKQVVASVSSFSTWM